MSPLEKAQADLDRKKLAFRAQQPLPGQRRLQFEKATDEPFEAVIRSPLTWWHCHPGEPGARFRRCGHDRCVLCSRGLPVQTRFVLCLQREDGRTHLFELSERHTGFLEHLRSLPRGQVGAKVRIFKKWKAPNAPICIELLGTIETVPIEIDRLVSSLGLPALVYDDRSKSIDSDHS